MKVAEYIVARLQKLGIDTCFLVTGGGAMHLNDAIGGAEGLKRYYCHHEQSCSFAADVYARVAKKPALVNVTTGPGGINALNGVFGAFTDSLPMVVVSGQVKRETLRDFNSVPGLRQLGDQEADIISMVKPITKWAALARSESEIADLLDRAFREAVTGRPGPVWLDVPVDVQGMVLPPALESRVNAPLDLRSVALAVEPSTYADVLKMISEARRPVILAGTGVAVSATEAALLELAETLKIPVASAWTHDIFPNEHALYAGRPGTIGTRDGNFILQNSDLVLVLGSRLNIRQTSYNYKSFARGAKKVWVDIDEAELSKPFVKPDVKIVADLRTFLPELAAAAKKNAAPKHGAWVEWCQGIRKKYAPKESDYPVSKGRINSYHFFMELFAHVKKDDLIVCGDATATIVPYQVGVLKEGMRLISNSGSASMGFDIPGALGAIAARPNGRVICLAGDGSGMMNLQELQTLRASGADVKVFMLNNDGYLSIKQTQRNFFGREAGSSTASGLTFPDFVAIGRAFGFESSALTGEGWKSALGRVMNSTGPVLCDVQLDLIQEFEPRLKSKMVNGVISTPELEDMHPFLDEAEVRGVRESAQKI